MASLKVKKVSKNFVARDRTIVKALDSVSFNVADKEFVAVIGQSGCGKTTLLSIVAGFEKSTKGCVIVGGNKVERCNADRAVIFQDYALFPWLTVYGNISFGLEAKGIPKRERGEIIQHYIKFVGLTGFEKKYPREISGGMAQRVGIARALALSPSILLMDEPFGSLDAQTRTYMQDELIRIWQEDRRTVMFVTHSIPEAVKLADRIVVLSRGPGKVKAICEVNCPRPRKESDKAVLRLRRELSEWLQRE